MVMCGCVCVDVATSSPRVIGHGWYNMLHLAGPLGFIRPGWIHRVLLTGLPTSTKIFYRVSHGNATVGDG